MKQTDVIEWVADQCERVLDTSPTVSVDTPSDHVGLAEQRQPERYPFVGIQRIATASTSAGIGNGRLCVDGFEYTDSGLVDAIVYRAEPTLRVNVIPVTDGQYDVRDELSEELATKFATYARSKDAVTATDTTALPDDLDAPRVGDATPQSRAEDFVYADGVALELPYQRYVTDDTIARAAQVELDVNVGDSVSANADAIDDIVDSSTTSS